jgi:histidinol phosphatase-like enzyme
MNNGIIKELDPVYIQRANDACFAFKLGDGIAREYKRNIQLILAMEHLTEEEKIKALNRLHELRSNELVAQGNSISPYVYGPAVINKDRDEKNYKKLKKTAGIADSYFDSLQSAEEQYKMAKKKEYIKETFLAAEEKGLKEITVKGKTWYKLRKNWTTKKPKPKKAET